MEAALEELRKYAGTQFDPVIVDIFIEKVLNQKRRKDTEMPADVRDNPF